MGEVRSIEQPLSEAEARARLVDQATRLKRRAPVTSTVVPPRHGETPNS